jgi:hypothetical protein
MGIGFTLSISGFGELGNREWLPEEILSGPITVKNNQVNAEKLHLTEVPETNPLVPIKFS